MSAVIKSREDAAGVKRYRPTPLTRSMPGTSTVEAIASASSPGGSADDETRALTARIETLAAERGVLIERAGEDGYARGRLDADTLEGDRLKALGDAMERALAHQADALSRSGRVGAELARLALARVFDRPEQMQDMVARALALQLAEIEPDLVSTISLSAKDFPDPAALEHLQNRCSGAVLDIAEDRPSGFCVIRSTLGQIDASIDSQWSRLAALLAEMADGA